jgi:UDP-GlcNAc:undecaprenyl-phosphate GlcNAc-1-phosphate transferase
MTTSGSSGSPAEPKQLASPNENGIVNLMFQFNNPLLVFALAFMGCVLSTPVVTSLARRMGAIDRPDQFRRVHKGAIPRMGGIGLAFGLVMAMTPVIFGSYLHDWPLFGEWWGRQWSVVLAGVIILVVGVIDDTRGIAPRPKLLGQSLAVLVLIIGGIQITEVRVLGIHLTLSYRIPFELFGQTIVFDPPSLIVTLLWFLACMNIWNLIDGMDGLASGVGLIVSGTLMFVALRQGNEGSAAMAIALAGSLAGFLLYNWHPALIFLGDSGSLLIGLLIGIIGVQDSMKGTTTVSILFPILAMGLPISDTAMAIFRRWVRNLPLSSADRRHIHHLLIGLGLNPRQAALILYFFTGGLCGVVLLGVALNNPVHGEFLALFLGITGCLAFLLILTSRRDELASLKADWRSRKSRKRQERSAAKLTWEAIQRIELCPDHDRIWDVLSATSLELGCDRLRGICRHDGQEIFRKASDGQPFDEYDPAPSGPSATFRLTSGEDLRLTVFLRQSEDSELAPDIAFRSLQRLALATVQRLERIFEDEPAKALQEEPAGELPDAPPSSPLHGVSSGSAITLTGGSVDRSLVSWRRWIWNVGIRERA